MKRIVMFTNTFEPMIGGLERSVANAFEDLNSAGHLCRVVTPNFKGAEHSVNGVLRVPAWTGIGDKDFSIPLPTINRIEHWMEAIDPQLLHSHQPFLLGDTAWRVSRLRRIPLVFTHHTLYERYAHYLPFDFERARRMVIDMTTQYANRCQIVIAPTASVRRMLLERGIHAPIEVAPSGIDLAMYGRGSRARGRAMLGLQAQDEVVGHLGRLSQEKNLSFLVAAILHLMQSRSAVKCLLVGEGDRFEWVRAQFAQASLDHRLIAPGVLTGNAAADAYAAMDVFAFASKTDTQGLVLVEAMAAGIPVVALSAPGASDCIVDGRVGRLLAGDATEAEFAQALASLLNDAARLQAFAANARREALQYSRSQCVQRLLTVYERALAEYRPDETAGADRWDQLAERFDVEWTPFWEKVTTAFRAFATRPDTEIASGGS